MENADIDHLNTVGLNKKIRICLEQDGDGILAVTSGLPCYYWAETKEKALNGIRNVIQEYWEDLNNESRIHPINQPYYDFLKRTVSGDDVRRKFGNPI